MEHTDKQTVTGARNAERVDMTVYVDLENARKAITAAAIELVRGDEYAARMILIDWLAEDRGERIPVDQHRGLDAERLAFLNEREEDNAKIDAAQIEYDEPSQG